MTKRYVSLALLSISLLSSGLSQRKEVIGYFPSWKWRMQENAMTPERIPYDRLTIINYAFFYPRPNGTLAGYDTVGDALYLHGTPGTRLTDVAHRNNVKVLLSLGGWESSDNFPAMSATPATRSMFAHQCTDAIRQFEFDGIDIDWEYPGYVDHKGTPADKGNFTLLLQELRDSLRTYGAQTGHAYLLTAAFAATASHSSDVDYHDVIGILDQFNIMTYDLNGSWGALCNHNSPLYPSAGADSALCVDAAYTLFTKTYGVPTSKLNLGIPFYGHSFTGCTVLNSPHTGADTTHFRFIGETYAGILSLMDHFTRKWDDRAKVPYLVSTEWNELVSYDDEESVRIKCEYMMKKNVHGCIIWEITQDFLPDGTTPLLNAVAKTFVTAQTTIH